MDLDPYEEDMENIILDDERERHWVVILGENYGRVDNQTGIVHDNMWDVYMKKKIIIKGLYCVDVSG